MVQRPGCALQGAGSRGKAAGLAGFCFGASRAAGQHGHWFRGQWQPATGGQPAHRPALIAGALDWAARPHMAHPACPLFAGRSTIACYNPYQANDQYPSNSTDGTWSYHTYPSCCCSFPYLNGPLIDDLARLE